MNAARSLLYLVQSGPNLLSDRIMQKVIRLARKAFALLGYPREEDLADGLNSVSELIYISKYDV